MPVSWVNSSKVSSLIVLEADVLVMRTPNELVTNDPYHAPGTWTNRADHLTTLPVKAYSVDRIIQGNQHG